MKGLKQKKGVGHLLYVRDISFNKHKGKNKNKKKNFGY